jgi:hypothetical protein
MKSLILCIGISFSFYNVSYSQALPQNFADVNGDGYLDKIEYIDYGSNIVDIKVSYGKSDGGFNSQTTYCNRIDRGNPSKPWGFKDINMDDKADFITFRGDPKIITERLIYLSTGGGLDTRNKIFADEFDPVGNTVILDDIAFYSSKLIVADKVVFKAGYNMRLANGAILIINAKEIKIETTYTINAIGNRGRSRGSWEAHNGDCCDNQGHEDFEKQKALGDKENKGGMGEQGGSVYINYCVLSGVVGVGSLNINTSGGYGGTGLYLICPCHKPNENFYWTSGDKGPDGIYKIKQKCN